MGRSEKVSRIRSFDAMKTLGLFAIFWQHSVMYAFYSYDIGERMLEVIMLISGFLTMRNHCDDFENPTWGDSLSFMWKHMKPLYPLHLAAFVISAVTLYAGKAFTRIDAISAVMNIFLVQSWSPFLNVAYTFNVSSWYLCAYAFCCFMTPVLICIMRKMKKWYLPFVVAVVIRLLMSYLTGRYPNTFFTFHEYVFPPVRCAEYMMGLASFPIFRFLQEKLEKFGEIKAKKAAFTAAEVLTILLAVFITTIPEGYWYRAVCIALTCPMIIVFAFDEGLIGKALDNKVFRACSKYQMEFFIFHLPAIQILERLWKAPNRGVLLLVNFIGAVLLSILAKKVHGAVRAAIKKRKAEKAGGQPA